MAIFQNLLCPAYVLIKAPPVNPVGLFLREHIFPAQFGLGVIGNILVLIVLNSKGMRRTTNQLLSAMAASNLLFFLIYFPEWLLIFHSVKHSLAFMKFYLHSYVTRLMIENSLSASAIWIAVSVSIERVIAICYPLHAPNIITKRRILVLIVTIFSVALLINFYVHFMIHVNDALFR